jgi:hypothetical protein
MSTATQTSEATEDQEITFGSLAKPELAAGEVYVGAIINSKG